VGVAHGFLRDTGEHPQDDAARLAFTGPPEERGVPTAPAGRPHPRTTRLGATPLVRALKVTGAVLGEGEVCGY
jgi:hypothetical protein